MDMNIVVEELVFTRHPHEVVIPIQYMPTDLNELMREVEAEFNELDGIAEVALGNDPNIVLESFNVSAAWAVTEKALQGLSLVGINEIAEWCEDVLVIDHLTTFEDLVCKYGINTAIYHYNTKYFPGCQKP